MCGRIVQAHADAYVGAFGVQQDAREGFTPSYNISPTQHMLVVVDGARDGLRRLVAAHWSLIPSWSRELRLRYPTFNARIETASERPAFRQSVPHQRAVVPVDGYYEWQTIAGVKTPFYVHADQPIALAGLYGWWRPSVHDDWLLTATILTRPAPARLAWLHERAPVTVPARAVNAWCDPHADGRAAIEALPGQCHEVDDRLSWHAVAPLRGDGAELIAPVG